MPTPTRLARQRSEQEAGPTRNYSRHFDAADSNHIPADDAHPVRPNIPRSTSYTAPLPLGDRSQLKRQSAPLTRENLQALLQGLENPKKSAPTSDSGSARPAEREYHHPAHMPKTKSSKKTTSRKSRPDPDSHPLNLPPEDLRRLSAAMTREEARNGTPMNLDDPPMTNGASLPTTPAQETPGAFPDTETGNVNSHEERSPTPPPHKPQKVDPEACKAAGNKYFKAKDYDRAVQEYTKGKSHCAQVCRDTDTRSR
jgi:hypothetical protein